MPGRFSRTMDCADKWSEVPRKAGGKEPSMHHILRGKDQDIPEFYQPSFKHGWQINWDLGLSLLKHGLRPRSPQRAIYERFILLFSVSVSRWVYASAHRCQKRALHLLKLDLSAILSHPTGMLGTEFRSFERTVRIPNC